MATDEAQGLLQREVAELLGVSRPRVAQLVAAGHLRRNAAGKIDPAEVERCKRQEAIAWQHPPAPPPAAKERQREAGGDQKSEAAKSLSLEIGEAIEAPVSADRRFMEQPAPPPPAPAAAPAHRDDLALHRELHRLQDLEQRWLSSYTTFWEWIRETHYERALWRQLGDQPEIGAVMVEARALLVARLADLNEVCAAAQLSR